MPPLSRTSPTFSQRGTSPLPAGLPRFGSGSWERVSPVTSAGEGAGSGARRSTGAPAGAWPKSSHTRPVEERVHEGGHAGRALAGSRAEQQCLQAAHDPRRRQGPEQPPRRALQWTAGDLPLTPRAPAPAPRRPVASPLQPRRSAPQDLSAGAGGESGSLGSAFDATVYRVFYDRSCRFGMGGWVDERMSEVDLSCLTKMAADAGERRCRHVPAHSRLCSRGLQWFCKAPADSKQRRCADGTQQCRGRGGRGNQQGLDGLAPRPVRARRGASA